MARLAAATRRGRKTVKISVSPVIWSSIPAGAASQRRSPAAISDAAALPVTLMRER